MLYRESYDQLLAWKNQTKKKCLIVKGARQVGKTYLIEAFGKNEYENVIEINFLKNPGFKEIFKKDLDTNTLKTYISLYLSGSTFTERKTLVFLDEIQECPEAITSLKFWAEDGRYDVIASGSMLGIDYKRPISYPVGYVDYLDMTSLNFREFLVATGVKNDIQKILENCFAQKTPVPEPVHKKIMELLRTYMIIGGMPEVVNTYIETQSILEADKVQRRILTDYRYDIAHYATADMKIKAENCYLSIPSQLGKDNHKFQYSLIEKGSNARKYGSSIDWLEQANLAIKVYNVDPLYAPLATNKNTSDFRLYIADIGLLVGMMDYSIKAQLLNSENEKFSSITKGAIYEALIAEMLFKANHTKLYFTKNAQGTFEIEYLIESADGIIPIEVKSGRSRSKSLDNLLKKDSIPFGYKLVDGNVGVADKKITLPLYMAMFI